MSERDHNYRCKQEQHNFALLDVPTASSTTVIVKQVGMGENTLRSKTMNASFIIHTHTDGKHVTYPPPPPPFRKRVGSWSTKDARRKGEAEDSMVDCDE